MPPRAACGPLLPFAPSCMQRSRKGRWPGVRSPAPRSRGTVFGLRAWRHQHRVLLRRLRTPRMGACARTPSHLPRHSGGVRRLCMPPACAAGRWWCPRAQDPFAVSANRCSVNPVLTRLRFARLDGAPRAWAGERGRRRRPGVATLAGTSLRTAAMGRNPTHAPDPKKLDSSLGPGQSSHAQEPVEQTFRVVAMAHVGQAVPGLDGEAVGGPLRRGFDVDFVDVVAARKRLQRE